MNNDPTKPASVNHVLLEGLTVLDFTRVLAGPTCTRLMADLGATVIKIERPGEGDEMRRAPSPLPGPEDHSTYFARRNAGKRSVGINLATAAGRELALALVAKADVVIENFMPGVMEKLGLDYETCKAANSRLVYCSISGYGQTGPEAARGAFAHVVSAASGVMYLDAGSEQPRSSHSMAADVLAGTNAFGAILAALMRRDKTGMGAQIDVSMLESLIASEDIAFAAVPNGEPSRPGPRSGLGLSQIGERWIAWQSGGAPMLWKRLCEAMERMDLFDEPRFATADARRENWLELQEIVSAWLQSLGSTDAALAALTQARIPAALVATPEEVVRNPQLEFRQTFQNLPHSAGGTVKVTASPFWIDGAPVHARETAPLRIGEHSRSVLSEILGLDDDTIDNLAQSGDIAAPRGD